MIVVPDQARALVVRIVVIERARSGHSHIRRRNCARPVGAVATEPGKRPSVADPRRMTAVQMEGRPVGWQFSARQARVKTNMTRAHDREDVARRFPSSICERLEQTQCRRGVRDAFADHFVCTRISTRRRSADCRRPWKNAASLRDIPWDDFQFGSEANTKQSLRFESGAFSRAQVIALFTRPARRMPPRPPTTWCDERLEPSSREARCAAVRLQHQTVPDGG